MNSAKQRGTIRARGRGFQALIKHEGRQLTVGVFDNERDAQEELDRWAGALIEGLDPRLVTATVEGAFEMFLGARKTAVSINTHRLDLTVQSRISPELAAMRLSKVEGRHIRQQVALWADNHSKATAARYRAVLGAFHTWAVEVGAREGNPVHGVKVPNRSHHKKQEMRPFSRAELDEVVQEIREFNPTAADHVLLMALTGLRPEELRELRIFDVHELPYRRLLISRAHPEAGIVGLTKTRASRFVPLTDEAWAIIARLRSGKSPDDLLVATESGAKIRQKGFRVATRWDDTAKQFWKDEEDLIYKPRAIRAEWKATGRGRRLYDLRHTAATLWLEEGLPLTTVAQWMGHASVTTTAIYSHWLGHGADRAALEHLNKRSGDKKVTDAFETGS